MTDTKLKEAVAKYNEQNNKPYVVMTDEQLKSIEKRNTFMLIAFLFLFGITAYVLWQSNQPIKTKEQPVPIEYSQKS